MRNRLYPALLHSGEGENVHIYDLVDAPVKTSECTYLVDDESICDAVIGAEKGDSVIWIETPTHTHIPYLKKLLSSKAAIIAVEKPLATKREDLDYISDIIEDEDIRKRVFFLSYYVIEKALPLRYIADPSPVYERYLDIEDKALMQNCLPHLGALLSAEVNIVEGEDRRIWANNSIYGGQMLETFIHNILIASLFVGTPDTWSDVSVSEKTAGERLDISLSAAKGKTEIKLHLAKNAPAEECCRYARFVFASGRIDVDLEKQDATVYFDSLDKDSRVSVKHQFMHKYLVMVDLVSRAVNGSILSEDSDGIKNQIAATRWILDYLDSKKKQG